MKSNVESSISKAIDNGEFDLFDLESGKRKTKFLFQLLRFLRKNYLSLLCVFYAVLGFKINSRAFALSAIFIPTVAYFFFIKNTTMRMKVFIGILLVVLFALNWWCFFSHIFVKIIGILLALVVAFLYICADS